MTGPRGRCAGCGYENASVARVARHTSQCEPYLKMYQADAAGALAPEAEWVRYHSVDAQAEREEVAEDQRSERREANRLLNAMRAEAALSRWSRGSAEAAQRVPAPEGAAPLRCAQSATPTVEVATA